MSTSTPNSAVPYYSQWESADLVPDFVSGRTNAADDPLWQKSGAESPEEYAFWAPRICGVACLRMALDHWGHPVPPSIPLLRDLLDAGAYVREGDSVKGLIYRPFTEHVRGRWGLTAYVRADLPATELPDIIKAAHLVLLSVHKTIRTPEIDPSSRGGHLVLAVGASKESVLLNNPSGFPGLSQQAAEVPWDRLNAFYAGRGVVLGA